MPDSEPSQDNKDSPRNPGNLPAVVQDGELPASLRALRTINLAG